MKSAKYVDDLITEGRTAALDPQALAWEAALACVGWAYVFGARGEYCTTSTRKSKARDDHPTIISACQVLSGKASSCAGCKWYPASERTRVFDCRGFTYWILLAVYGFKLMGAGATSQWNDESNWSAKGEIATMPQNTLVCLFVHNPKTGKKEHTGFGFNGETIECSAGVQHFTKRNKKWTHWAVPKCVASDVIPSEPQEPSLPTLRKGSKGDSVVMLQQKLLSLGYDLGSWGADGSFGNATEKAVKAFQKDAGLTVDGVVGSKTWEALEGQKMAFYAVTINHLSKADAESLAKQYPTATIREE